MKGVIFIKCVEEYIPKQSFVGFIPFADGKKNFLIKLSDILDFPDYFGHNWDALCEVYRDFSWITNRQIVIIHQDLSGLNDIDLKIYIDIVRYTLDFWSEYDDHSLQFVFSDKEKSRMMKYFGHNV